MMSDSYQPNSTDISNLATNKKLEMRVQYRNMVSALEQRFFFIGAFGAIHQPENKTQKRLLSFIYSILAPHKLSGSVTPSDKAEKPALRPDPFFHIEQMSFSTCEWNASGLLIRLFLWVFLSNGFIIKANTLTQTVPSREASSEA